MDELLDLLAEAPDMLVLLAAALCLLLVARVLRRLIRQLLAAGHLTTAMANRLQTLRRWGIVTVAIAVGLQSTGLFAHAWALISAMLATIAVAFFATWSILSNATGAVLVLTFRPFRAGDQIELVEPTNGTVFAGEVVDMNLLYTTLRERDPETGETSSLHIPNNLLFQKLVRARRARGLRSTVPFFRSED